MRKIRKYLIALIALGFLGFASPGSADVNDFSFSSFAANYELKLNKAKDNRPEMWVTETLVANFPDFDQNHGLMRSIPETSYGELPGLIDEISVTDEFAAPREFEVTSESGFLNLAIKPADGSYVRGKQTYVISYHQAWVIKNFQNTSGFDEFYWDVNGTGWLQSFDRVSATVTFDDSLKQAIVADKVSCYQGAQDSTETCSAISAEDSAFKFTSRKLNGGENLTIVIPFKPGVANTTGPIVEGTLSWYGYWICLGLVILILLWAIYFRLFFIKNQGKQAFIVPHYKPELEPGLMASAMVMRKTSHLYQASVVELAINNLIEIEVVKDSKSKDFILRRTNQSTAKPDYKALLTELGLSDSGSELVMGKSMPTKEQTELSKRLIQLRASKAKTVNSQGYFLKRALGVPAMGFGLAVGVFAALTYFAGVMDLESEAGFLALPILSFAPFSIIYWLLMSKRALSAKGTDLVAKVKGLELYIQLAEKDRLEFLQSPSGAALKPSELKGKSVLKLYEEILPWAIMLGLQKEWSKVLTDLYGEENSPVWLIGSTSFGSSFGDLDSVLSASLASSSSGGSGGGGSSGGGGGGGGGSGL